ncbi:glucan endo-1,3-beta-glucosidase-like [Vicia villosa]|uniref:glucan endo-1,3-beta-glucosidase-like n=1 Tax=Vicia villosa TaxID=3911 RepID=UPI00273A7C27|nr:glucan endo-1,3-beta-glucosidase-like [Vicia villosa]
MIFLFLFFVLIGLDASVTAQQTIGVCYGQVADNLPPKDQVIKLFQTKKFGRMRIFNPDQATLEALKGSNIELVIGVANEDIKSIANDISAANAWVQNNIVKFSKDVKFKYIGVGNEIDPANNDIAQSVPLAMKNIDSALASANLKSQIKVSTVIYMGLLGSSYPPSAGAFNEASTSYMTQVVSFLVESGAPLLANVYPYFAYISNTKDISLDYALFKQSGNNDVGYQNLFDAQLDAIYAALAKVGGSNLKIVVSESGWPSAGGDGASIENAGAYYTNLIAHVNGGKGTPAKPGQDIETYLFAMFDEYQKPGAESEKHFGLFHADQSPKYSI